ncbi:hypothetical protein AXF42_Ash021013 [Apostasia shenzhenica]|uniref:Uncharacterized protein n=1 Tax=Apostasia shenzhenica TaxID=1088818 RepID=A0A2I0AEV6_9ASPA|nr:hypothetical protein AXF42_Ash021013 [Apostasia shenzhenica]
MREAKAREASPGSGTMAEPRHASSQPVDMVKVHPRYFSCTIFMDLRLPWPLSLRIQLWQGSAVQITKKMLAEEGFGAFYKVSTTGQHLHKKKEWRSSGGRFPLKRKIAKQEALEEMCFNIVSPSLQEATALLQNYCKG